MNVQDWIDYELRRMEMIFNRLERFITSTLAPHAGAEPSDDFARLALEQMNGLKSGIAMIVLAGSHRRR